MEDEPQESRVVVGPNGSPLTRADLPKSASRRWLARHKAEVVIGVENGLLTLAEAGERYWLSLEEYLSWRRQYKAHGLAGLRSQHLRRHR